MERRKLVWTEDRCKKLRELYPDMANRELAVLLGVTERAVSAQAFKDGLRKSPEFMHERTAPGRFKPGHVPMNKGRKANEYLSPEAMARMSRTHFKPGHIPHNAKPLGSERVYGGYIEVKVSMSGERAPDRWKAKQRLVWEQHHGAIPEGYIVVFKDGNNRNFDIENLELRDRSQHWESNIGDLPEEYRSLLRLKGAVQRQLNKLKDRKDG